jgi:hypothetical protein
MHIDRALAAALALVTALLAAFLLSTSSASAGGPIVAKEADDAAVRAYWTPARMRAAKPVETPAPESSGSGGGADGADGPPRVVAPVAAGSAEVERLSAGVVESEPTTRFAHVDRDEIRNPSAVPFRSHGKVFFSLGGDDYVCSGTAISAPGRSVVWTAGHCVYDPFEGRFAGNWVFVPAYRDGESPFGKWPAERLATTKQWRGNINLKYDLGAAEVQKEAGGQTLTDVVGGRGIGFNQPRRQRYQAFGYPAVPPPLEFTGEREFRCTSDLGGTDDPQPDEPGQRWSGPRTSWIHCDMTAGSSGGGWVADRSVLSVNSYSYCADPAGLICEERMYGPYQNKAAEALYRRVAGEVERCAGREVTHLGTPGDDRIVGTPGNDVIKALGGDDVIIARGGKDVICAGPGNDLVRGGKGRDLIKGGGGRDVLKGGKGRDVLRGGGGNDRLFGGPGNDRLFGGPGRDRCDGGPGRDRARGCERERRIP